MEASRHKAFLLFDLKNIRKYRKAAKLSQEKLAEMCECSNGHIGMIENAKTTPSLEMIVKISNSLKVTVDMLINESYVQPELKYLQDIEAKLEKYRYSLWFREQCPSRKGRLILRLP